MEENNKGFIFISNDKEVDTTIKINYRSFVFFDVYGLENDKIYKIVDDLVYQFDLRAGKEHFFEEESFVVLIEGGKEIIQQEFEGRMFYFLECSLLFPPQALRYDCYFCWEKLDSGELQAYWTSDFPEEELKTICGKIRLIFQMCCLK